jgi:hypothetical protein
MWRFDFLPVLCTVVAQTSDLWMTSDDCLKTSVRQKHKADLVLVARTAMCTQPEGEGRMAGRGGHHPAGRCV